ncbi:MAG: hypothetical protein R6U32_01375 [Candidatus Woesearchaeota archaeon]
MTDDQKRKDIEDLLKSLKEEGAGDDPGTERRKRELEEERQRRREAERQTEEEKRRRQDAEKEREKRLDAESGKDTYGSTGLLSDPQFLAEADLIVQLHPDIHPDNSYPRTNEPSYIDETLSPQEPVLEQTVHIPPPQSQSQPTMNYSNEKISKLNAIADLYNRGNLEDGRGGRQHYRSAEIEARRFLSEYPDSRGGHRLLVDSLKAQKKVGQATKEYAKWMKLKASGKEEWP